MFSCDGISDHASWSEVFHYWDTKFSWESLVDHNRESLGEFARTIHQCFKNKTLVLWFDYSHIAVELTHPRAHERD